MHRRLKREELFPTQPHKHFLRARWRQRAAFITCFPCDPSSISVRANITAMLLFALVVIPLAYISLPILVLHNVASRTQTGRYYWKLSVYVGSLVVVSTWGVFIAVGMTLAGLRHDVNYVVARTFYALTSRALGITVEIEGEEHLQTRPAVMVANHQSMLDVLWLGRSVSRPPLS